MLLPMLAALSEPPLDDPQLAYEPKYDGIRAIVEVAAKGHDVRIWSRLGNDKTHEYPGIVAALARWASTRKTPVVLDGEVVALDAKGEPAGFQQLQRSGLGRRAAASVARSRTSHAAASGTPGEIAFIAFDLLRDGATDLRPLAFVERRKALERVFGRTESPLLRLSEVADGDGHALYERALASGWEGLIAKRKTSRYLSGKRSPDWRKLKIVHDQEFVIGGWTDPRNAREHFGALLLGVYDDDRRRERGARRASPGTLAARLRYVGHVGTGFDSAELARLMKLFKPLATKECPFQQAPPGNEKPHWIEPTLVAQVRFTEWTADGILRHPVYLGLRDDKKAADVRREPAARRRAAGELSATRRSVAADTPRKAPVSHARQASRAHSETSDIVAQLTEIERGKGDGLLDLPGGIRLSVTNLRKVFWPRQKYTKGDLLRYYASVAPFVLRAVADRPLVMKRFPNGIDGPPFYQHRAQHPPAGVRVEPVLVDNEMRPQFIGGDIATLLHMTQLAAISQDPWFSRVQSIEFADYVAIDLDPSEGVGFGQVLDVARWVHEELEDAGALAVPKTSGADGLHIYLPLPPKTPYHAGLLVCQIVATVVARKHPRQATIERFVKNRGQTVYVDYLQNIQGKTLATAYSARASEYAGVSTPLTWKEVHKGVKREDFTIKSTPARFLETGDLWAPALTHRTLDLARLERYARKHKLG